MVHIDVFVGGITKENGEVKMNSGIAYVSGSYNDPINFEATYAFNATALQKNVAIMEAAIAAAAAVNQDVGALDNKTLYAPATAIAIL